MNLFIIAIILMMGLLRKSLPVTGNCTAVCFEGVAYSIFSLKYTIFFIFGVYSNQVFFNFAVIFVANVAQTTLIIY